MTTVLRLATVLVVAGTCESVHAQWQSNYSIRRVGLYGPEQTGSAGLQNSDVDFFFSTGMIVGGSARYTGSTTANGQNTWVYNPNTNTTAKTGLTDAAHTGTNGYQDGYNTFSNANGQTSGTSARYTGAGAANGQSSWFYDPITNTTEQIGLTDAEHTGSSGYRYSNNELQTPTGQVIGFSWPVVGDRTTVGQSTWVYNPAQHSTVRTGLLDAQHTGSAGRHYSSNDAQSAAGQVAGYSNRYDSAGAANGQNTWSYNTTAGLTVQTGLTDAEHTGSAGYQYSQHVSQDAAGRMAGISRRITGVSTNNGQNAWVYDPATDTTTPIGLTDALHTGSAGYQYSFIIFQSPEGRVAGYSNRVSDLKTSNGQNTWVYDSITKKTIVTGLTDALHTGTNGYHVSSLEAWSTESHVAGRSLRVLGVNSDNGRNTWVYDQETMSTIETGLTDAAHTGSAGYQYSTTLNQTPDGVAVGTSQRIVGVSTSNGQDAWYYSPYTKSTVRIGLTDATHTGSNGYGNSSVYARSSGFATGVSSIISGVNTQNGQSAWIYNPRTNVTTLVGLTDAAHTGSAGYQMTVFSLSNSEGRTAGFSNRIAGVNTLNGENTWAFDPATLVTVPTGLTDATHTATTGYQYSSNVFQNEEGVVAGFSQRFTPGGADNGRDVWYFDPTTLATIPVIGDVRPSDNYAFAQSTLLTEDGYLLGNYLYFPGGLGAGEKRAFIFRPDLGLTDLGNLVNGGLTANGWATLQNPLFSDALRTIVGYGQTNGQAYGSQSVFIMVPAPGAMGVLGVAGLLAARRRR